MIKLNEEQDLFVKSPLENSKLLGIAGGGKTTTSICKILHHMDNKTLQSKCEFLITTFSRKACDDFIEKGNTVSAIGKKKPEVIFNGDNVRTFHSLAGSLIRTVLGRSCSSLQIAIISAINAVKSNSKKDLQKLKCLKNLKLIIVDEAQDMSDIQYELMCLLKDKLEVKMILVGDPNQNIHQFQNGSDKYLLEYKAVQYHLKKNNRSSPEITNFINFFRPWNYKLPQMESSLKPTKIKPIIFSGTQDEICNRICQEILKSKIPREKIAIIGPVKKSNTKEDGASVKFGLQKITNLLSKKNIKHVKHYNEWTEDIVNLECPQKKDYVNVYTIHGSKGLEFDKVIVVNFHFKTFGKIPSIEEYNQFKYLWYVALSRAKTELFICCDNDKLCWNELLQCPQQFYDTSGDDLILKEPKFGSKNICAMNISEIVMDKKLFTEDILLNFYKEINFTESVDYLYDTNLLVNDLVDKNQGLSTHFLKAIFEYYYGLFHGLEIKFIKEIKNFLSNVIYVNKKYSRVFSSFRNKCGLDLMSTTNLEHLKEIKSRFNKEEIKLFWYVSKKVGKRNKNSFSLVFACDDVYMNSKTIKKLCDKVYDTDSYKTRHWTIFKLCLFKYQYENEAKYMWTNKDKFKEIPTILQHHINKIIKLSSVLKHGYTFRTKCVHPNLKSNGIIDLITNTGHVTLIKFSSENKVGIDLTDKIKLFLYYHSYYNKWNLSTNDSQSDMTVEIWNFKTGKRHSYKFDPFKSNLVISTDIANVCKVKLENMMFVYDLETTGLKTHKCEIIERYVHEMTHDVHFSSGVIKAKLKVPQLVINLTGITQIEVDNGENLSVFAKEMTNILNICYKPTFIAHNGNAFDHQIMRYQNLLNNNCNFLDSKSIIGQLSAQKTGGETLGKAYELVIGYKFKGNAHRARADVMMLLEIFKKLNVSEKDLLRML